jgi:hypothetical protein
VINNLPQGHTTAGCADRKAFWAFSRSPNQRNFGDRNAVGHTILDAVHADILDKQSILSVMNITKSDADFPITSGSSTSTIPRSILY